MVKNVTSNAAASAACLRGGYVSPELKIVLFRPEGVLCSSGMTEKFEEQDYSDGSFWN